MLQRVLGNPLILGRFFKFLIWRISAKIFEVCAGNISKIDDEIIDLTADSGMEFLAAGMFLMAYLNNFEAYSS